MTRGMDRKGGKGKAGRERARQGERIVTIDETNWIPAEVDGGRQGRGVENKSRAHLLLPALTSVTGLGGPLALVFGDLWTGHC